MEQVENTQQAERIKGPLICFHQYGENDDLEDIFKKINDFKIGKKIKYTHFTVKKVIYFSIPSTDVNDFSKVIRFSKSKSSFKSSYDCGNDKEEFDKLNSQKDSFIKIRGIEKDNGTFEVVFRSNLPKSLHIKASKRIFSSANVKFDRDKCTSDSKPYRYDNDEADNDEVDNKESNEHQENNETNETNETNEINDADNQVNDKSESESEPTKVPKKRGRPASGMVRKA